MCQFLSAVVTPKDIFTSDVTDSHELIILANNLIDDPRRIVRVEYTSNEPWDISTYELKVDQDEIPDWFEGRKETVERCLHNIVKRCILSNGEYECLLGGRYILCGDVSVVAIYNAVILGMHNDSKIKYMYNDSKVEHMYGDSKVEHMYGDSKIKYMHNNSKVERMHNNSKVIIMYGDSNVEFMYDDSKIKYMYNDSKVERMYNDSKVEYMHNNSKVITMYGDSKVENEHNEQNERTTN